LLTLTLELLRNVFKEDRILLIEVLGLAAVCGRFVGIAAEISKPFAAEMDVPLVG